MKTLDAEQAAVIAAYTGYLIGEFSVMHAYVEKILGRPVFTHELGNDKVCAQIREAARKDFMSLQVEGL